MAQNLVEKILSKHLVSGTLIPGEEIGIRIDQTLTQDATGTMAYLQFESMNMPKVKTELSVSYVDHNTIQIGFENADDQLYLQTVAQKYGMVFSRAGNGICHQIHLERFGKPGKTRKDPDRVGQPYAHLRGTLHDRHRRGRTGCGAGDGRKAVLSGLPESD